MEKPYDFDSAIIRLAFGSLNQRVSKGLARGRPPRWRLGVTRLWRRHDFYRPVWGDLKDLSQGQESSRVKKKKQRTEGKRKMTTQTSLCLLLQIRREGGSTMNPLLMSQQACAAMSMSCWSCYIMQQYGTGFMELTDCMFWR